MSNVSPHKETDGEMVKMVFQEPPVRFHVNGTVWLLPNNHEIFESLFGGDGQPEISDSRKVCLGRQGVRSLEFPCCKLGPPARCPFTVSFVGEGCRTKIDVLKKAGTLIPSSLLEDLDG